MTVAGNRQSTWWFLTSGRGFRGEKVTLEGGGGEEKERERERWESPR